MVRDAIVINCVAAAIDIAHRVAVAIAAVAIAVVAVVAGVGVAGVPITVDTTATATTAHHLLYRLLSPLSSPLSSPYRLFSSSLLLSFSFPLLFSPSRPAYFLIVLFLSFFQTRESVALPGPTQLNNCRFGIVKNCRCFSPAYI